MYYINCLHDARNCKSMLITCSIDILIPFFSSIVYVKHIPSFYQAIHQQTLLNCFIENLIGHISFTIQHDAKMLEISLICNCCHSYYVHFHHIYSPIIIRKLIVVVIPLHVKLIFTVIKLVCDVHRYCP